MDKALRKFALILACVSICLGCSGQILAPILNGGSSFSPGGAWTFTQSVNIASTTTHTLTSHPFPNPLHNPSTIFCSIFASAGTSGTNTVTLTDTAGNTYNQFGSGAGSGAYTQDYYAENFSNATSDTVTATSSGATINTYANMECREILGASTTSPVDVSHLIGNSSSGTGTDTLVNTITTTANGDLILGTFGDKLFEISGAGTGYTQLWIYTYTPASYFLGEYQVQATAGTINVTASTAGSTNWDSWAIALRHY